jgi:hypothetical protein
MVLLCLFSFSKFVSAANYLCVLNDNKKYAVYNGDTNQFLDPNYSKSEVECRLSISFIREDLFCAVDGDGYYAVRNVKTLAYISKYFSMDFTTCRDVVAYARDGRICLKGKIEDGFARYDIKGNKFFDSSYGLSFDECNLTLDL